MRQFAAPEVASARNRSHAIIALGGCEDEGMAGAAVGRGDCRRRRGGLTALNPGFVRGLFDGVYPIDPARRKALTLCFEQDQRFNRLDAGQRDDCYRRMLFSLGDVAGDAAATPAPVNIIDLQRAAGQGGMIHNDIRQQEATQGALHSPH